MGSVAVEPGTVIHYREVGSGAPALLVHGWMASGHIFDKMLPLALHRCIVPDHRGTGASTTTSTDESIERLGRDMIAVADAAGLTSFALVGHSMGGLISQWIASEVPERVTSMVIINAVPPSGVQLPPEADGLFSTSGGDAGKQGTILDLACKKLDPADRAWMVDAAGKIEPERITRMYRAWAGASFVERLSKITARTLVVATDDPFLPPEFLKAAIVDKIRGATMTHLAGPGHYPVVETPVELRQIVDEFLAQAA